MLPMLSEKGLKRENTTLLYFTTTAHNVDKFEEIWLERKRLMNTCHKSRVVAMEIWKEEIEHLKLGDTWYGCMPREQHAGFKRQESVGVYIVS